MRAYADAYNDFVVIDGTHNVSCYAMKLMPVVVVDCLGKSKLAGYGLDQSENRNVCPVGSMLVILKCCTDCP